MSIKFTFDAVTKILTSAPRAVDSIFTGANISDELQIKFRDLSIRVEFKNVKGLYKTLYFYRLNIKYCFFFLKNKKTNQIQVAFITEVCIIPLSSVKIEIPFENDTTMSAGF